MRFNVAGLLKSPPGTRKRVTLDDPLDIRDPEVAVIGPITGGLALTRELTGILVEGSLEAIVRVACSRCLEPVEVGIELAIEEHFQPSVDIPGVSFETMPEDMSDSATQLDAQHTLDLSEVLRQSVLVSVPFNALCSAGCKGLCPECGADLNRAPCACEVVEVDARWSALRALIEDR